MTENEQRVEVPINEACPHCGRYINRGISVDAVMVRGDEILLVRRRGSPYQGYWANAGGFVDWNESVEEAVVREVFEETGLRVSQVDLVGVYSSPARHERQVITIAFWVEPGDGTPRAGDDAAEVRWFPLGELPEALAFDHRQIIADALKQRLPGQGLR